MRGRPWPEPGATLAVTNAGPTVYGPATGARIREQQIEAILVPVQPLNPQLVR